MNIKVDWKTIELLGYSYFSSKGYRILVQLVKSNNYDFVTEYYGEFKRVNVKVAGLKDRKQPNSWSVSMPSSKFGKEKRLNDKIYADIYLVWLPFKEKFIELPGDFFKGYATKCVRIPKQYLL